MARPLGSTFEAARPILKQYRVAACNWGFVDGKSQTRFPWNTPEGAPEPDPWFHDILRPDGSPFDPAEVDLLRRLGGVDSSA